MTSLALGIALLLALAGWMLRSVWTPGPTTGEAPPAHLGLLADRIAALDREHAAGRLDPVQHRAARAELERRVLDEAVDEPAASVAAGDRRIPWAVALVMPAVAISLYAALGDRTALDAGPAAAAPAPELAANEPDVSPEAVDAMLGRLAKQLETPSADPAGDAQGWTMLARSYAALQRFAEADRAFARAIALAPADATLLADRADVLAMRQDQRLAGEPEQLVERALAIDPRNLKALALAGTAAYERRDFATARRHWRTARDLAPAGAFADGLDRSLAELDGGAGPAAREPGPSVAASPAGIRGHVRLDPALAARAAPTDTVFIVARAADGPRMPLAVIRRTVADLPFDFTLDDTLAMQPALKLSAFERVVVSARVSRSGDASARPGDLVGDSGAVSNRAADLTLAIDTVQP